MTLIELVVSMCIFSIMSLTVFTSFSVVIQRMSDASNIKNRSNAIASYYEGSDAGLDLGIQDYDKSTVVVSIQGKGTVSAKGVLSVGMVTESGVNDLQMLSFKTSLPILAFLNTMQGEFSSMQSIQITIK